MLETVIGLLAGTLTTVAFLPQAIKTWKSKSAEDLSLGMYSIFCSGVVLWFIYGILTSDFPVMIANGVTLVLALSILYFKLAYDD